MRLETCLFSSGIPKESQPWGVHIGLSCWDLGLALCRVFHFQIRSHMGFRKMGDPRSCVLASLSHPTRAPLENPQMFLVAIGSFELSLVGQLESSLLKSKISNRLLEYLHRNSMRWQHLELSAQGPWSPKAAALLARPRPRSRRRRNRRSRRRRSRRRRRWSCGPPAPGRRGALDTPGESRAEQVLKWVGRFAGIPDFLARASAPIFTSATISVFFFFFFSPPLFLKVAFHFVSLQN